MNIMFSAILKDAYREGADGFIMSLFTVCPIMFSAILKDAYREGADGFIIKFRYGGGGVFNLNRLQAKSKSHHATVGELLFADDCDLRTGYEAEMNSNITSTSFLQHETILSSL